MLVKTAAIMLVSLGFAASALAQVPPQGAPLPIQQGPPPNAALAPPPVYPAAEIERIVSPIALYPDPLLAQLLAAATFWPDIPDAARWADEHHYLNGPALTAAIAGDRLPWDPAVQAMLPFPSVLGMMASSMPWTEELGAAFLAQESEVMDAVQRLRQRAQSYGYLRSNGRVMVQGGPYVEIIPVNPAFIVVPYYDPVVVFAPPRRGLMVGSAISFGFGVTIGSAFAPWGWGAARFGWNERVMIVNDAPWRRGWSNRTVYVHPYAVPRYQVERRAVDQHRPVERSGREREAERTGRGRKEEHKPPKDDHRR